MPIIIKGTRGNNAGKVFEFDESKEEILFGRSTKSDVLFPADNVSISRQHLSLKLENDRYQFRMQADNPVFFNGEEAFPNDEIPLGQHTLVIGLKDSPEQFEIEVTSQDEEMAVTEPSYKVKATARQQNKKLSRMGLMAALILVVVGVIGYNTLYQTSLDIDSALANLERKSEKANQRANFEQSIVSLRNSVYLVAIKRGDSVLGQGTAWVVGDGLLATNAHVVEGLREAIADGDGTITGLVVSPSAPEHVQHNIINMKVHPHYEAFEQHQSNMHRLMDDGSDLNLISAYDVALLEVDNKESLAEPLSLASDSRLMDVDSGTPLAFIGYPMEDAAGGGVNYVKPTPQVQFGAVTSVTDYFMVGDNAQRNHLIQHSLPAHGGASGSPVFDLSGNVVALFNAGNVIALGGHRVATGIGINFAQRVDVLKELINDQVDAVTAQRVEFWGSRLSQYKTPSELIANEWKIEVAASGVDVSNVKQNIQTLAFNQYSEEHDIYYWEGQIDTSDFKQALVVAEPTSEADLDLVWYDVDTDKVAEDTGGEPYAKAVLGEGTSWPYMQQNNLIIYSYSPDIEFNLTIFALTD